MYACDFSLKLVVEYQPRWLNKPILISYSENRHVIKLLVESGRDALLQLCHAEFEDLVTNSEFTVLIQQKKAEEWERIFVDYTESCIEDRSIFELVSSSAVGLQHTYIHSHIHRHMHWKMHEHTHTHLICVLNINVPLFYIRLTLKVSLSLLWRNRVGHSR